MEHMVWLLSVPARGVRRR